MPSALRLCDRTALLATLLAVAACTGEPGSGAAYVSPPFGEYTTPFGPTDVLPDSPTARGIDPFFNAPVVRPRRR